MKVKYKIRNSKEASREIARLREQVKEGLVLCWDHYGDTFSVVYRGMWKNGQVERIDFW